MWCLTCWFIIKMTNHTHFSFILNYITIYNMFVWCKKKVENTFGGLDVIQQMLWYLFSDQFYVYFYYDDIIKIHRKKSVVFYKISSIILKLMLFIVLIIHIHVKKRYKKVRKKVSNSLNTYLILSKNLIIKKYIYK